MGMILENLHRTLLAGLVLTVLVIGYFHGDAIATEAWAAGMMRYIHVFTGILWIGLALLFQFRADPFHAENPR